MAGNYASAVRNGTMAAARLHQQLNSQEIVELAGGGIDVFSVIHALNLPLLLRPLQGLLGVYLTEPHSGILITTERPMSIQRFTASHELGHFFLKHRPSLDDETVLRRMTMTEEKANDFQETEADSFAVAFMMPKWLILSHCARQNWKKTELQQSEIVYQLSLRLGASFEAICRTLNRYNLISTTTMQVLLASKPRDLKIELLKDFKPENYRGDVWRLTERDAGTRIDGSKDDLFVLKLKEHSGGGYLWNLNQLKKSGFAIVHNETETIDRDGIGGPVTRHVTAAPEIAGRGQISLNEQRPWLVDEPLTSLVVDYDLTGPEPEGLSRAERRHILEAI